MFGRTGERPARGFVTGGCMGKGDTQRPPQDWPRYRDEWDRIFSRPKTPREQDIRAELGWSKDDERHVSR